MAFDSLLADSGIIRVASLESLELLPLHDSTTHGHLCRGGSLKLQVQLPSDATGSTRSPLGPGKTI